MLAGTAAWRMQAGAAWSAAAGRECVLVIVADADFLIVTVTVLSALRGDASHVTNGW